MAAGNIPFHVLLAMTAVLIVGRLLARGMELVRQPPVIGEVLAGIALGPSLLGRVAPDISAFILPAGVASTLGIVAQIGVVLYMFLVGLELSTDLARSRLRSAIAISQAGVLVPFAAGAALSLYLYPRLGTSDVSYTRFALFMGVAMSITAFPVLARILTDRGIAHTELGHIALTSAAIGDVTIWCVLAILVGLTRATVGAVLAAAFLAGLVIPNDSRLARGLRGKPTRLVIMLLLPAFFAFTGMRTQIGLVTSASDIAVCALIIVVATAGKFGGAAIAARLTGMDWRGAASLGILMNTRGLMELIVLNIGLDLGVISPQLFTMMVLMALVTTIATTPVLQALHPALQSLPLDRVRPRAAEGT